MKSLNSQKHKVFVLGTPEQSELALRAALACNKLGWPSFCTVPYPHGERGPLKIAWLKGCQALLQDPKTAVLVLDGCQLDYDCQVLWLYKVGRAARNFRAFAPLPVVPPGIYQIDYISAETPLHEVRAWTPHHVEEVLTKRKFEIPWE